MKVLGLDLGTRTLGVAISDDLRFLARPIETVRFEENDLKAAKEYVLNLLQKEPIDTIVLGYPRNMDGSVGGQGHYSEAFQSLLQEDTTIPVLLWDERLTSKVASAMMKDQKLKRKQRKDAIDAMAATVILQSYLDRN
jgi:putative Holliday junction resolvase